MGQLLKKKLSSCPVFFVGTNAVPTPLRKVSDLDQKRCENFSNFHISKFFIHIHGRRQQLFQPPAIFAKIAEKLKSFRLSTPAFKKSVDRSQVRWLQL